MIKVFIVFCCLHIFAIQAATEVLFDPVEAAFLDSITEIKLCVGPDTMPFDDIEDGRHVGLNSEYMLIFSDALSKPIVLVPTTNWEESMDKVKSGLCDIISVIQATPQRKEFLYFTEPYINVPFVVVTTQDKFFVSNLSDLLDKDLAINKGYAYVDLIKSKFPSIHLMEVNSRKEGLEKVNQGEIFGYLSALHLAGYAIQMGGYTHLKISGEFDELSIIELGIGINKKYPHLVTILDKVIKAIPTQEKEKINSSWLTVRYQIGEDYKRLIQFIIAASVILIFLFYRQYHLRKHNTQLAHSEKEIWQQANFDFLTGLPNRRLFQEHLEQEINLAKRKNISFALLLIDLDGFKEVNDTLGHDEGDRLLVETGTRIQECIRKSDSLARLGGDEFVVILHDIKENKNIEKIVNKLLFFFAKPFYLTEEVHVTASIGITLCPKDSSNMLDLIKNSDQAMYAAKANGRNTFQYFTQSMQTQAIERMLLIKDLRVAMEEQQFEVYYQPIIDLTNKKTFKAEALIRWQHPTKGLVSPLVFIQTLEETRMIDEVGDWVFLQSAQQVKIWREKYDPLFQISVNISPIQFQNSKTNDWADILSVTQVSADSIGIEITENMLMESHEKVSIHLLELRDAGFQVSLDDFGTGYSSLSYLKKFDIDYLKIDQSFVKNLSRGSNDLVLCEAIIVMAHKLGLKVIAEGIETEDQHKLLTDAGCDFGQGYLFSKPVTATEFEKLL